MRAAGAALGHNEFGIKGIAPRSACVEHAPKTYAIKSYQFDVIDGKPPAIELQIFLTNLLWLVSHVCPKFTRQIVKSLY